MEKLFIPTTETEDRPQAEKSEKTEVIEKFQEARADILTRIIFSKTADNAANYIPGVDVVKMTIEGVLGKTLSAKKLSHTERLLYILSSAAIAGFYLTGDMRLRLGASAAFDVVMLPKIYHDVTDKTKERFPRLGAIIEQGEAIILKKADKACEAFNYLIPRTQPLITSLDLDIG